MEHLVVTTQSLLAGSVPLILAHKPFSTENTVLESTDKVPVAWVSTGTASSPSLTCAVHVALWGWRVVSRAWLQPDRSVGVEVTGNSLDGGRDAAVRVYRRGTLAASPRGGLCVQALGRRILSLRHLTLHEMHWLTVTRRLRRIRRGCRLLVASVHAIVHRRLRVRRMELVHLHRVGCLGRRVCMCSLGSSLLARSFGLLLLLNPRWNGLVQRCILQVHGRHKGPGKLLLRDEGMQFGLLGGPPLQWVDSQKTTDKVNKSHSVVQFCNQFISYLTLCHHVNWGGEPYLARFLLVSCSFWALGSCG